MNRLLLSLLLFAAGMTFKAQDFQLSYHPFSEEGKTCERQVGGIKENLYCNRIDGDTLIYGESWKKVYNYIAFPEFNYRYYASIRDVGKKVYAIAKGDSRPRLLYDFGLKTGDVVSCGIEGNAFGCLLDKDEQPDSLLGFPFVSYLKVERIDTIKACGMERRRFTFTLLNAYYEPMETSGEIIWVEGIGSGGGPFSPWMPLPPRRTVYQSYMLNGTYIFSDTDFYDPEVLVQVGSISSSEIEENNSFSLSGHRLTTPPTQKGIYIRDGKKVLIK